MLEYRYFMKGNRKMKEVLTSGQLIEALFAAAKAEKWDEVDQELVPQLAALNGNELARLLLNRVDDADFKIRDVVATAMNQITITDKELQRTTVLAMCNMSINDGGCYPAGRAVAFCVGHEQDIAYDLRLRALMKSAI